MPGETDLARLLATLDPDLHGAEYVVVSVLEGLAPDLQQVDWFAAVQEPEGLTLVLTREEAEAAALPYEGVFRRITLQVESSLEAVGLTAAVAGRLALEGISANVIAAFHHDHLLVPAAHAERALTSLRALQGESGG